LTRERGLDKSTPPPPTEAVASGNKELFPSALQDLDVGVAVVGPGTEALLFNHAALELLDLTPDQLKGLSAFDKHWDVIHEDESKFTPDDHPSARAIRTKQPVRNVVAGVYRPSKGDRIWLLCSAVPHLADDGSVTSVVCSFSDITALRAQEMELQKTEERFRLLVEGVRDYAIFMLDPKGYILSWNPGAERIKGYRADEIIGKHFSVFYSVEDIEAGKPARELEGAAAAGRTEDFGWRLRKDGSRFWANVVVTALRDPAGRIRGFAKVTRDLTETQKAEEVIRASQESLRELSAQLFRIQDEERRRMSRELHDSLGQKLVMLKMHLEMMESGAGLAEGLRQKLLNCVRLSDEAIKEVRTTSYTLYPPMLEEMGLNSAIPWFLDGFMERSGIVIRLEISPQFTRLHRDVELAIFRVLQESLTNVLRHSGSKVASVKMEMKDGAIRLEVHDQGKGIPPEILDALQHGSLGKLGIGLRGMKERLRQLGGKLEVSSTAGGSIITATVPCGKGS